MDWLVNLFSNESVAHAVLILALAAAIGLALGSIRIYSIHLGVAGVLFAGLTLGHFGLTINHEVLEFIREFGLILFVYTIGLQVGPGFFASLRKQGLPLNLMAAGIVILGALLAIGIWKFGMTPEQLPVAVGIFSGATTNTPSLAAAQDAIKQTKLGDAAVALPGLGYAVAYPFGIMGIILTMLLTRKIFRVNLPQEAEVLARLSAKEREGLSTINLEVQNANLQGLRLRDIPTMDQSGVVVSRLLRAGKPEIAQPDSVLHMGDILHAVGPKQKLNELKLIVGAEANVDVKTVPSNIASRRILVTKSAAVGQTIADLDLRHRYGVNVTRVHRAEIQLPAGPDVRLQFADSIVVVGDADSIKQVARELGDLPKQLDHPQIIPVFVGIVLGVILGSWPLYLPGMPAAVKLGLAGGPLVVAILLSRIGNFGPLVWYMPASANFMLREVGIVMFLACVGLKSGDTFVETLMQHGLLWLGFGAIITFVPLMTVALIARMIYKINYLHLCGLLAGSMTDPPALAFASTVTGSDAPSIAYATVYPLTMLLRVVAAQAIILIFAG